MRVVLSFDKQGLIQAELISIPDQQEETRELWQAIQKEVQALNDAIQCFADGGVRR